MPSAKVNNKAQSITSVLPRQVVENYPYFLDFMEKYYEWQKKTTVRASSLTGKIETSKRMVGISTEVDVENEVVVNENECITEFDSRNTFIRNEIVAFYQSNDEELVITESSENKLLINDYELNTIDLFAGYEYRIRNELNNHDLVFSTRKSQPENNLFGRAYDDVRDNDNLFVLKPSTSWNNVFFISAGRGQYIAVRVNEIRRSLRESFLRLVPNDEYSLMAFGFVESLKFHPEYLVENFSQLNNVEAPNYFYKNFLDSFGIGEFYANNFENRRAIADFIRFFQSKGTEAAIKFFFQNFFNSSIEIDYPRERIVIPSEANYRIQNQIFIRDVNISELEDNNRIVIGANSKRPITITKENVAFDFGLGLNRIFFNSQKNDVNQLGSEHIGLPIYVMDDDDSSILYDIGADVIGVAGEIRVNEGGLEYKRDQIIDQTVSLSGSFRSSTRLEFKIDSVSTSPINQIRIEDGGQDYETGDLVLFPKPTKIESISAKVQEVQFESDSQIKLTLDFLFPKGYDKSNFDFNNCTLFLGFMSFTNDLDEDQDDQLIVDNIDGDEVELRSTDLGFNIGDAVGNRAILEEGKTIVRFEFPDESITDPYYDDEEDYFDYIGNSKLQEAYGFVEQVDENGSIQSIKIQSNGSGYIKRPRTERDSIWVISENGSGADINVVGHNFGGMRNVSPETPVVGIVSNTNVDIEDEEKEANDEQGSVTLVANSYSKTSGVYMDNVGFISDTQYIHDSFFYQNFSYVIQTNINYEEYASLFREIAHPAGYIFIGEFRLEDLIRTARVRNLIDGVPVFESSKRITIEKLPMVTRRYEDGMPVFETIFHRIKHYLNGPLTYLPTLNESMKWITIIKNFSFNYPPEFSSTYEVQIDKFLTAMPSFDLLLTKIRKFNIGPVNVTTEIYSVIDKWVNIIRNEFMTPEFQSSYEVYIKDSILNHIDVTMYIQRYIEDILSERKMKISEMRKRPLFSNSLDWLETYYFQKELSPEDFVPESVENDEQISGWNRTPFFSYDHQPTFEYGSLSSIITEEDGQGTVSFDNNNDNGNIVGTDTNFTETVANNDIVNVVQTEEIVVNTGDLIGEVWSFTGHTGIVHGVAVDNDGYVYSGSQDDTVKKIDPDGNEVWEFTGHTSIVYSVDVDDDGNVYSGSSDYTVRKIDSDGNEVWEFTGHTIVVNAVAVDADGNVYSGSNDDTVRKIDSDGNEVWKFTGHIDSVYALTVDSDGHVYSGSLDETVRKIDSDGNEIWKFTGHTNYVYAVTVDSDGHVYSSSSDQTVKKIDSDGNEVWSFTGHTGYVSAVDVDLNENVYSSSSDQTVKKIDSDGNEVWSFTGHTGIVRGVAVDNDGYVYSCSNDDTVRKIEQEVTTEEKETIKRFYVIQVVSDTLLYSLNLNSTDDDEIDINDESFVIEKRNPISLSKAHFRSHKDIGRKTFDEIKDRPIYIKDTYII